MAFADKYRFTFNSIDGDAIQIDIQQDNYGGSLNTVLLMDADPLSITWQGSGEREEPILGSTAVIRFISSSNFQFHEFFYAKDQEYKVIIQKNSNTYWAGWVVSGQYSEPIEKDMYPIELVCTDGLGDLDNIPLRDSNKDPLTGQYTFGGIIQECLTTNNALGLSICDNSELFVDDHTLTTANNYRYRVTLTGTSGTANIAIKGTNYLATFSTDLNTTASNFESTHSVNISTNESVGVNAVTNDIDFVSPFDFTVTITNVTGDLSGTVSREFDSALGNITLRVDGLSDDGNIPDPAGKVLWSCGEALRQILSFSGCRLFQSEGKWIIQDILRDGLYWQKQHDTTIAARTDDQKYIDPIRYAKYVDTGDIYPINVSGNISTTPGHEKIEISYDAGYKKNFLSGGFDDNDFSSSTELYDWIRASGSHLSIFSGDWNTTTLTINKIDEADTISCEILGVNTEQMYITSFSDNGAGQLRVNNSGTNPFAVNDVIFIDYPGAGEDGNYYGFHTVTARTSSYWEASATTFTTDDSEEKSKSYHYFNSTYLEQEVNPQETTINKNFTDEDGQEVEIKIRYKVQDATSTERDDWTYHIPVMIAIDGSTDYYVGMNREWSTDTKSFYRIEGSKINTWEEETITISLDKLSGSGNFHIGLAQLATGTSTQDGYGSNATGYLVSDITARILPDDLALISGEKTLNGNFSDLAPPKSFEYKFAANRGIFTFQSTYSSNPEFINERHLFQADETAIATANDFANQDKQAGQDLDDWHGYRIKKMYAHNAMIAGYEFKEVDRQISIEPYNYIHDNLILGRRFLITSLSKNLKENTASFEGAEIKPREDVFECISGTLSINNHVSFEPNHFTGSPSSINEFINIIEPFNATSEQVARANDSKFTLAFDSNNTPYINQPGTASEDVYKTSSTAFGFVQPYTVMLAVDLQDTVAGDRYLYNSADGITTTGAIIVNNDGLWIDGGTKVDTGLTMPTNRIAIITVLFNGASSKAWINTTASATLSAGTDQANGANLLGDNPTSGSNSIDHNWYGTYIYGGSLSDTDRELVVNKLLSRTRADKLGLTLSVSSGSPDQLDITFSDAVTGFTTDGLTLVYKTLAGTQRSIQVGTAAGSGTAWAVDLSGDIDAGDVIYLTIDDLNPATTTVGKFIYPGIYPITNNI